MKASKKLIHDLRIDIYKFTKSLNHTYLDMFGKMYQKNKMKTLWQLYWHIRKQNPVNYNRLTHGLKDRHIETALKRAVNLKYNKYWNN